MSITLPDGIELVVGNARPPAEVDGQALGWARRDLPDTGTSLRFSMRSTKPGRFVVPETSRLDTLDGWYNFDALEIAQIDSPVLHLPRLASGRD